MPFDVALADESRGVVVDFSPGSSAAVNAFGGLLNRMGIPPFEFFGQLADVPASRVFIRDLDQAWYQCGIRGVSDDISSAAEWLKQLLKEHDIRHVVCAGSSSGGFGAILFGCLIDAQEVHAFGAQTTIEPRDLRRAGDTRWDSYLAAMQPKIRGRRTVLDVKPLVRSRKRRTHLHLHWGLGDDADSFHARRLARFRGVDLLPYEGLGHADLARELRDRGELRSVLMRSLRLKN